MKICHKNAVSDAADYAGKLAPSVLALARVMKVTPTILASALQDEKANARYYGDLVNALVTVFVDKAVEEAEEAEETEEE